MRPARLSDENRGAALSALAARGWKHDAARDSISKSFRFKGFAGAFGWMTQIALMAEKLDHHPEWFNVYNRVEVTLTTHDARGLTELDLQLAEVMDQLAAR